MSNRKYSVRGYKGYEKVIFIRKTCKVCGYGKHIKNLWIVQDDPEVQCPRCLKKDIIIRDLKDRFKKVSDNFLNG